MMSGPEELIAEDTIVLKRPADGNLPTTPISGTMNAPGTNTAVATASQIEKPPAMDQSTQQTPMSLQQNQWQASMSSISTSSTPESFAQLTQTITNTTSTPEIARSGGRRSRGMRHRGSPMMGASMSVFSVKPDSPRTPTARARGSVRSKPSRSSNGSNKRKRSNGNGASDSESSENFTPLSQSRSGRKIIQVAPIIKIEDEPKASPKTNTKLSPTSVPSPLKVPERKRSNIKKIPGGASAVCKNCGRLHSPDSNAMVFCDGCNTGWHQHCHDPPIPQDIVLIESKEWFCTDCIVLKEEKSRLQGKVSGQHMSLFEKRRHLQTLSSKELVSLLLHACSLHPDLPIFNVSSTELAEDVHEEEEILPYPKPGNGLVLPPEKDHIHILLDDDTDVYSHCTSGIAQLVAAARANLLRKNSALSGLEEVVREHTADIRMIDAVSAGT